jgi:hypothetical protein
MRTFLLGLAFLTLLLLSSYENTVFFNILPCEILKKVFSRWNAFLHNVLVVSLILLGMSLYVSLVKFWFFKREKYSQAVLEHHTFSP